jgi:hypothetical protein
MNKQIETWIVGPYEERSETYLKGKERIEAQQRRREKVLIEMEKEDE